MLKAPKQGCLVKAFADGSYTKLCVAWLYKKKCFLFSDNADIITRYIDFLPLLCDCLYSNI